MLDHKKHLRVDGVLFQRHPETGKPWTKASAKAFIEALRSTPEPVDPEPEQPALIKLDMTKLISSIDGEGYVAHKSDLSLITGIEAKPIIIKGNLGEAAEQIKARVYSAPLRKSSGGYVLIPVAVAEDGKFSITFSLASDIYTFSSAEINEGFPQPLFDLLQNIRIDIRQEVIETSS